jgi:hypothetical protein
MVTVQRENLVLALGSTQQYSIQKCMYVIKACVAEILDRNYINIYILSDCQAAIKAVRNYWITSKLIWDCHQALMQMAKNNTLLMLLP